ncbi:MAG TPA: DNA gyrase subunit A, partial [Thermoplasmata archaeon]|nr:DNA gyrase subunit A [Thermoplasmata archaeon]
MSAPRPPTVPAVARDEPDRLRDQPIEREMHRSYIDYAMSVIVGRALPEGRDGLKPVQRRILWSMWESGATHDRPYRKSARTVGDVLGKYHPHGELAVYDALVRMAQPFSLRYPLIDGQGNFGSIDGDSPAAMRYTEARLSALATEMLEDVEKETVSWSDNFDGTLKEPMILPGKLPNLLVNGSAGIAVGMATNMPPHNLSEIVDALLLVLERPDASLDEIMQRLPGPDFPTGGLLAASSGIREAYATGRGMLRLRGKAEIRERDGRDEIVITEIPYEVNKTSLLELIADLVKTKRLDGITDLRDESDREGTSIVLELRKDAPAEIVLNRLFEHTPLESSFGVINLCLVEGRPKVLPLKALLQQHVDHRRHTITRRTQFDLARAEERLHLLEGFLTAIDHIDEVIKIIRRSKDVAAAEASLMGKFLLSSEQAKAILASSKELDALIVDELTDLKKRFGDARRTTIVPAFTERTLEDLIPDMDVVVLVTRDGYIKRLPLDQYRRQRRGGRGLIQMETKEEDYVIRTFLTRTHDNLLFFTTLGRVYRLKAILASPKELDGLIVEELTDLKTRFGDARRTQLVPAFTERTLEDLIPDTDVVVLVTRDGYIKRLPLDQYRRQRRGGRGLLQMETKEEDYVIRTFLTRTHDNVLFFTTLGRVYRLKAYELPEGSRHSKGKAVINLLPKLKEGERVQTMLNIRDLDSAGWLFFASRKGIVKR